jgi:hypothetical protein
VSTDAKSTKILARTFFNQLRGSGYSPNQVIGVASELIELVTEDLRQAEKPMPAESVTEAPTRQTA